jgi:AcrR family transcriptional regulator
MTTPAKERRRDEILVAAKRAFAATGYHSTKMGDVARTAGVSHGTVYLYFASKDELFRSLMDHEAAALRDHLERTVGSIILDGERDGEELLRRAVRATFEFFEADRDAVALLFRDSLVLGDGFDRHLARIYEGFITDIEKSISIAQETGHVVDVPPRLVAFTVASVIGQVALRRLATDDGLPADAVADVVVTLLLDGLRPRREAT